MRHVAIVGLWLLSSAASAQTAPGDAGAWWGGAATRAPFAWFNPLTTAYGRIGVHRAWVEDATVTLEFPGGASFPARLGSGFGGTIGFGARLAPALRLDLTGSGTGPFELTTGTPGASTRTRVSSFQVMANLYLDLAPFFAPGRLGRFNPYLMAGAGLAVNRFGTTYFYQTPPPPFARGYGDRTRSGFAWQLGAGAQVQLLDHVLLDLSYRYLDAGRSGQQDNLANPPTPLPTRFPVRMHQLHLHLVLPFEGLARALGG